MLMREVPACPGRAKFWPGGIDAPTAFHGVKVQGSGFKVRGGRKIKAQKSTPESAQFSFPLPKRPLFGAKNVDAQ